MSAIARQSWKKQQNETAKAFAAFCVYLRLGAFRSLAKACRELGRPPGYTRQLQLWSRRNQWVARASDFDSAPLEAKMEASIETSQEVYLTLREATPEVSRILLEMARGRRPCGPCRGTGLAGDCEECSGSGVLSVRSQDQMNAAIKVLALGGVIEPKRVIHSGPGGGPIEVSLDQSPDELARAYTERVRVIDVTPAD